VENNPMQGACVLIFRRFELRLSPICAEPNTEGNTFNESAKPKDGTNKAGRDGAQSKSTAPPLAIEDAKMVAMSSTENPTQEPVAVLNSSKKK
jgi:hypothetical protein